MIQALLIYNGWAILLFRVILGAIFMAHGFRKLRNLKGTQGWFESEGFKPGWLFGTLVALLESLGGLCIILGFLHQLVALILVFVMLVALSYNVRKRNPFFKVVELDMILIAALLLLATLDNGYFSLNTFFGVLF